MYSSHLMKVVWNVNVSRPILKSNWFLDKQVPLTGQYRVTNMLFPLPLDNNNRQLLWIGQGKLQRRSLPRLWSAHYWADSLGEWPKEKLDGRGCPTTYHCLKSSLRSPWEFFPLFLSVHIEPSSLDMVWPDSLSRKDCESKRTSEGHTRPVSLLPLYLANNSWIPLSNSPFPKFAFNNLRS